MLTHDMTNKVRKAGFELKAGTKRFAELLEECLVEIRGPDWRRDDLLPVLRELRKDILFVLCDDEDGPRIKRRTAAAYWDAGIKSIAFSIEFQSIHCRLDDIPEVLTMVEQDTTKSSREAKVKNAVKTLHDERRHRQPSIPRRVIKLPVEGDDPDAWVQSFLAAIAEIIDSEAVAAMAASGRWTELAMMRRLCAAPPVSVAGLAG